MYKTLFQIEFWTYFCTSFEKPMIPYKSSLKEVSKNGIKLNLTPKIEGEINILSYIIK